MSGTTNIHYARVIQFDRVGVYTDVPKLTYRSDNEDGEALEQAIQRHIVGYLTTTDGLEVDVDPDRWNGSASRPGRGKPLAFFTVHPLDGAAEVAAQRSGGSAPRT